MIWKREAFSQLPQRTQCLHSYGGQWRKAETQENVDTEGVHHWILIKQAERKAGGPDEAMGLILMECREQPVKPTSLLHVL